MGQVDLTHPAAQPALAVARQLRSRGHEAFLVGGCVRDLLMGREPEDYDVATSAPPGIVASLFSRTVAIGAKFGVVVVLRGDATIEVATFRLETGYSDRRHPDSIEFSDARHDACRRDFTINGLFADPDTGEVVDFVGGMPDLHARLVRAIGDPSARFAEDALRLLRALRFASSLGFEIDASTWHALATLSHSITEISAERIRDELLKGFTRFQPHRFLDLLDESALLAILLPEVAALRGVEQPPEFHPEGDVFTHTRLMLSMLPPAPSPALALATLFHDIGKPATMQVSDRIRFNAHQKVGGEMADAACRRLVLPNDLREAVVAMVSRHMDFMNIRRMKDSTLRRFLAEPTIDEEIVLHDLDCRGSHGKSENCDFAREKLEAYRSRAPGGVIPPPLVRGEDLIALGLKPGPRFKTLLRKVQDAQLEGTVVGRDDALALLQRLVGTGKHRHTDARDSTTPPKKKG